MDEVKIECCQRESLTQSMWTMSFADQRDKVYEGLDGGSGIHYSLKI